MMIKIVEIYKPEKVLAPAPSARLTYNNGPLISNVSVITIFWGKKWSKSPHNATCEKLQAFFDFITKSTLIDELEKYSVSKYKISRGEHKESVLITDPAPPRMLFDSEITKILKDKIVNKTLSAPTKDSLYFVYLEPGITLSKDNSTSCFAFCGYHDHIDSKIFYAVMPFPDCNPCRGNLTLFDALTSTSSHELCEAITDPIPPSGWYDNSFGEIGDICAWKTKKLGRYTVQMEWSNSEYTCM